ncbi:kinase-like domain-containing protein [Sporodiniella umbellata]|nr:kinase-like domain-containing protein [Sporodiniella umbellata]
MQIVAEPYPANHLNHRRASAPTTRSKNYAKDKRRSSGALCSSALPNPAQKPKKYIGDYIVGKTLGKGASGRVKLGVHRYTGEQIAIKIISKSHLATNPAIEKAVRREIAIMKLIHHPNVMSLMDVIDDPHSSDLYLLLEYVEGGELFEYLVSKGRLDESEARHHFQQIILGLDYCHHHLICHRDLKPENLLLDANHNIKIADFGMASLQPLGSLLETSCGSPHYASPEIVAGMPYHGSACDIWSCGVILFALLTGHLPFDDENIRQLLRKVKSGKYSMPDSISPKAQDLIQRILVVDPSQRLTMKQIMRHPWFTETEPANLPILPLPPTDIGQPIGHPSEIDDRLLETIKFLWGEEENQVIVNALLQKEHNMQKVVYVLLQQHAERYWQSDHDDEAEEELLTHAKRDRRCLSVVAKPTPSWLSDEQPIRRKSAVETEKIKKSETFYSKFVKKALSPRRSSKDPVGKEKKPATVNVKRLSLRMPSTVGAKKFGFTLGTQPKGRKQLDLSMYEPVPIPALSDGSTLSSSSSSCHSSASSFRAHDLKSAPKSPVRKGSQASVDPRHSSHHRPTTPSLLSNSSTVAVVVETKPSWLHHLFFFKQPKVCQFVVHSTQTALIFRKLHKWMNKVKRLDPVHG